MNNPPKCEPRHIGNGGPGIPAAARDKVLERYVRLDCSRTTPGSGLGLSLVAAVAGRHGARLELGDNRPGLKVTLAFAAAAPVDVGYESKG